MKRCSKLISFLSILFFAVHASAQTVWPSPEVEQMYQQARGLLSSGKIQQAIITYQQAIQLAPDVMVLRRDVAQAYILSGNYAEADKQLEAVLKTSAADEQCFQLAASSKSTQHQLKKAKNIIADGLERFPHSGLLYHELGKAYDDANEPEEALKAWLDGIEADPAYHINYYEAARTYMLTNKPVWAVLYGEIFINLEQQTPRANETRKMLLAGYKRIFQKVGTEGLPEFGKERQDQAGSFEAALNSCYTKLAPVVSDGINTESLIMLRTRLLMEWMPEYSQRFSFSLFSFQDRLLREGNFDAYNQWLFGRADNQLEFDAWNKFHAGVLTAFDNWIKAHKLQPVAADFYNDKKLKGIFPKNNKR